MPFDELRVEHIRKRRKTLDVRGVHMTGIDQNIVGLGYQDRRNDQNRGLPCHQPAIAAGAGDPNLA